MNESINWCEVCACTSEQWGPLGPVCIIELWCTAVLNWPSASINNCARALSCAPNRQSRKWNTKLKEITPVSANGIDMVCARLIGTAVMNILIVPLRGSSSRSSILPQQSSMATFVVQGDPSDKEHCRLSTCDCSMLIDGGACKCATSSNGS